MNASTGGTAYLYTYPSSKINLERWTAENKNARIPAAHSTTNNTVVTDHFVQNTDYIKLRNVEIGYTLPKSFEFIADFYSTYLFEWTKFGGLG